MAIWRLGERVGHRSAAQAPGLPVVALRCFQAGQARLLGPGYLLDGNPEGRGAERLWNNFLFHVSVDVSRSWRSPINCFDRHAPSSRCRANRSGGCLQVRIPLVSLCESLNPGQRVEQSIPLVVSKESLCRALAGVDWSHCHRRVDGRDQKRIRYSGEAPVHESWRLRRDINSHRQAACTDCEGCWKRLE